MVSLECVNAIFLACFGLVVTTVVISCVTFAAGAIFLDIFALGCV